MSPFFKKISDNVKDAPKSVSGIMQGHKLADFLARNWLMALIIVIMAGFHIDSRYRYEDKVEQIKTLRGELKDLQIRQNILSSELMKTTLEANIVDRINERGLGLSAADTSLIKINKK